MQNDILTIIQIFAWHLAFILVGMLPLRRYLPRCSFLMVAGLSYIFNGALLMALSYLLDLFGVFSWETAWLTWLIVWVGSFLALRPGRGSLVCEPRESHAWLLVVALATLIGAYIRFYDAVTNDSFACVDTYVLCRHLDRIFTRGTAHVDYMAGFLILSGLLQWGVSFTDLMRFAPQVTAVLAIPLGFAFWRALYGTRAACLTAILLAGSAFCRPLLFYHTLFVQLVTVGLCLPVFLFFSIRAVSGTGGDKSLATFAAAVTAVFLGLTSTYVALVLVTLFALWAGLQWIGRRITGSDMLRAVLIAAVVPMCAIYYYGFALPFKAPEIDASVALQSRRIIQTPATAETGLIAERLKSAGHITVKEVEASPRRKTSPVLLAALSFVDVKRFELLRPSLVESITILAAFLVGAYLFVSGGRKGRWALSLSGFMILTCIFSSATGILELPGYKGRALYLMLFVLFPAVCGLFFGHSLPFLLARAGPRMSWMGGASFVAALLTCIPAVMAPPVVGVNAEVGQGLIVRQTPEDNAMVRFMRRLPAGENLHTVIWISLPDPGQAYGPRGKNVTMTTMWDHGTEFLYAQVDTLAAMSLTLRNRTRDIYAVIATADLARVGGWTALAVPEGFWEPVFEEGKVSIALLHETYRNAAREGQSR